MELSTDQLLEYVTPERRPLFLGVTGSIVARLNFAQADVIVIECSNKKFLVAPITHSHQDRRATAGEGASCQLVNAEPPADSYFEWIWLDAQSYSKETAPGVDQSNDSVILDRKAIIKWQLFAEPSFGATKELCLAKNNFEFSPKLLGQLWWTDKQGARRLLASVNSFIENAEDGWTWFPKLLSSESTSTQDIEKIASITAQMHRNFRQLGMGFQTQEITQAFVDSFEKQRDRVYSVNAENIDDQIRQRVAQALDSLSKLVGLATQAIHGDFHVGQILKQGNGATYVIDFDGDPLQQEFEQSNLKPVIFDVASMMCSIMHAGVVSIKYGADPEIVSRNTSTQLKAFINRYQLEASHELEPDSLRIIWDVIWLLEIRELDYANQFLERWKYAPLGALQYLKEHDGR